MRVAKKEPKFAFGDTKARPDNPLHALAEEAEALLDLRTGKVAEAKAKLTALQNDTTAPQGVRGRASGLLTQLGGS